MFGFFEQAGKVMLDQLLGVILRTAQPEGESIQRIDMRAQQAFETIFDITAVFE